MVDIAQQIEHWRDGAREEWQVAGRYPDATLKVPALDDARALHQRAGEVFQWLMQRL